MDDADLDVVVGVVTIMVCVVAAVAAVGADGRSIKRARSNTYTIRNNVWEGMRPTHNSCAVFVC